MLLQVTLWHLLYFLAVLRVGEGCLLSGLLEYMVDGPLAHEHLIFGVIVEALGGRVLKLKGLYH